MPTQGTYLAVYQFSKDFILFFSRQVDYIMPFFSRTSKQVTNPIIYLVNSQESQAQAKPPGQTRQPAPDGPQNRYQINQRCIYERRLPGEAYVTAHVERLQSGIYEDAVKMSNPCVGKPSAPKPTDEKPANGKPIDGKPVAAEARPAHIYGILNDSLFDHTSLTSHRPGPKPSSKSERQ